MERNEVTQVEDVVFGATIEEQMEVEVRKEKKKGSN